MTSSLAPSIALSYNSGTVDGQTSGGNGEASWVGQGFDYQPGFVERKYKACADKVQDEMTKWAADAAKMAKPDESDPEMAKKSGEVMAKYTECMTKASGMGMGGDMHGDMKGEMQGGGDMKGGADKEPPFSAGSQKHQG